MNSFSKRKVEGSVIIDEYGIDIFDSNGKRILSDVEYIITIIKIDGDEKVIIRDIDSDHDAVVLMKIMLYTERGFNNFIETCESINLSFEVIKEQIDEMLSAMVINENYELASKLKGEWDSYVSTINKNISLGDIK